ncbi:MAG: SDR family NAD(P)-dependent oxidoreductase [Planctomycetota bacterium]
MNRTALVTGANGAIGKAIAWQLAATKKFKVVLCCRDEARGEKALREIEQGTGQGNLSLELVDLSLLSSILALRDRWRGDLHVLINNAAATPRQRMETAEGLEMQFATNVMGYFWMISEFAPILSGSAPARVVNVASYWAGGLDLGDLQFGRRPYTNDDAYRQSKQADRMLTVAFAERLRGMGITVNSCHPGDVPSKLAGDLGFGGHQSAAEAALTPVWLAADPSAAAVTGRYFERLRESPCSFGSDPQAVAALHAACERIDQEMRR